MKTPILFALALLLAALVSGCATVGRKIDMDAVARIEKGKTTSRQVAGLIGSPDTITTTGGVTVWGYMYVHSAATATTYVPIVGAFAGGARTQMQSVSVSFGPDGVVSAITTSVSGNDMDMGLAAGGRERTPEVTDGKREK